MRTFFFLAALPLLASAWSEHTLLTRATGNATSCDSGDKVCGAYCIPSDYTCCPDLEGGCSADTTCQMGDNHVYGCCATGETCSGDGGAEYLSSSSTSTGTPAVATKTTSSTSGAQPLVLSQGLSFAVLAAGVVAML